MHRDEGDGRAGYILIVAARSWELLAHDLWLLDTTGANNRGPAYVGCVSVNDLEWEGCHGRFMMLDEVRRLDDGDSIRGIQSFV